MPIELAGISNVNEFYSEHYLQTVFEGDVQELRARWRAEEKAGGNPADRRLEKAGARWRRLVSDYKAERNDRKRLLIFREFAQEFLGALGYERDFPVDSRRRGEAASGDRIARRRRWARSRVGLWRRWRRATPTSRWVPCISVSDANSSKGLTKQPTSRSGEKTRRRPPSTKASSPCGNHRDS